MANNVLQYGIIRTQFRRIETRSVDNELKVKKTQMPYQRTASKTPPHHTTPPHTSHSQLLVTGIDNNDTTPSARAGTVPICTLLSG